MLPSSMTIISKSTPSARIVSTVSHTFSAIDCASLYAGIRIESMAGVGLLLGKGEPAASGPIAAPKLRDRRFAVLRRADQVPLELRDDGAPGQVELLDAKHACDRNEYRTADRYLTEK